MQAGDALARAKALLDPQRLARAQAAKLRYQRRQARLQRLQAESALKRQQALDDPLARALAKAKALAERDGGSA